MQIKKYIPHIFLFAVNLIYAANYSIAKVALPEFIQPFGFILIRVTGALVLFGIIHAIFVREKIELKDLFRLILCGLFGVAINQLFFFKGLSITTPINAALLMITAPIIVLIVSAFVLKEKITLLKGIGVAIGFIGAAIVITGGTKMSFSSDTALGDLFIVINAASYSLYLVLVKPLMKKYNPLTVIKWVFIFGFIPVIFFGFKQFTAIDWSSFTTNVWLSVAFVVVLTTFIAYMLNIFALKSVNPSVVSTYIYLQPILATIIAVTFRGDKFSSYHLVAGVLIFIGVYLVSQNKLPFSKAQD